MRVVYITVAVFVYMASAVYAQPVSKFVYPIDPSYSFGQCTSGFASISYHMYYDSDPGPPITLKGNHMGEDWNGYLSNGSSCGNGDEGAIVRAIGEGTIVSAKNQGNGRGNVLIIQHTLPDDPATILYSSYYHLQSFLQTSGKVYAGKPVGKLGSTGNVPAHLHWEIVHSANTSQGVNPWHDICRDINNYQSTPGHCLEDSTVARPFLTGTNAMRYIAPSLLVESRMYGITLMLSLPATYFTVSARAPGGLVYVFDTQGNRISVNRAVESGLISYGLLWWDSGASIWQYYYDSNTLVMKPGMTYAVVPRFAGLGLVVHYPSDDQASMEDLARLDMVEATYIAGFKYVDPDKMVVNPTYAPNDSNYTFYSMPMTKTTNASKGDSNFRHWVLYAQHNDEPWVRRYTAIWDADVGSWTPWDWRGNTIP